MFAELHQSTPRPFEGGAEGVIKSDGHKAGIALAAVVTVNLAVFTEGLCDWFRTAYRSAENYVV
jgi:hypothetical protein